MKQYWLTAPVEPNENLLAPLRVLLAKLPTEKQEEVKDVVKYYKTQLKTLELYRSEGPNYYSESKKCEVYIRNLLTEFNNKA